MFILIASGLAVLMVVFYLLGAAACLGPFKKAGERAWKAFVPIYNRYVLYGISWRHSMFWLALGTEAFIALFFTSSNRIMELLSVAAWIISIIVRAKLSYRISRSFGHGAGYAVGLFFFQNLFLLILGFGKSQYAGNSYIDDLIFSSEKNNK